MISCSNCGKQIGSIANPVYQQMIYKDKEQMLYLQTPYCKECVPETIQVSLEEAKQMQIDYRNSKEP